MRGDLRLYRHARFLMNAGEANLGPSFKMKYLGPENRVSTTAPVST